MAEIENGNYTEYVYNRDNIIAEYDKNELQVKFNNYQGLMIIGYADIHKRSYILVKAYSQ
jgi:hypothetical protein